jgi:hypothetical protein
MALSTKSTDAGEILLTAGSDFLTEDAWRIHECVDRAPSGSRITIDFRRVRECHDFALSLLARDLLNGRVRMDVQGMTQHQEHVLSFFGVRPKASPELMDFDPI